MNKKLLLFLPVLAFSISGCSKQSKSNYGGNTGNPVTISKPKGEEMDINRVAPQFVNSLIASFNHDAIGLVCDDFKLNAVLSGNYLNREYNSKSYTTTYRLINFEGNIGVSDVSTKILINNLRNPEKNVMEYSDFRANVKGSVASNNLLFDGFDTTLSFDKNISGNQFFDNSNPDRMYFEYNQDAYDLLNGYSFIMAGGIRVLRYSDIFYSNIRPAGKYFINPYPMIGEEYTSFSNMMSTNIEKSATYIIDYFTVTNTFAGNYVKAYKQSDTKYAIYGRVTMADINSLLSLLSMQNGKYISLFDDSDKGYVEICLTFDTNNGIIDTALSINIDADVKVGPYLDAVGESWKKEYMTDEQLESTLLRVQGNGSMTLKAIYDTKVSIDPIKDENTYAPFYGRSNVSLDLFEKEANRVGQTPQWSSIQISGYEGSSTIYPISLQESEEIRNFYNTIIANNSLSTWVKKIRQFQKTYYYLSCSFGYEGFGLYFEGTNENNERVYYSMTWDSYGNLTYIRFDNYDNGIRFTYVVKWSYVQ